MPNWQQKDAANQAGVYGPPAALRATAVTAVTAAANNDRDHTEKSTIIDTAVHSHAGQGLVHGQMTIIFVVSVCLSACLCRVFLSRLRSDFDQTRTYVIYLGLVVSPSCATPGGWVTPKNLYF